LGHAQPDVLSSIQAALPLSIGTVAFVDVNLVPMDRERVVPHQTILVEGRSISGIGPATMRVPTKALRVEGHGLLYLMPGLSDMHSHAYEESDFALYLANGVTTLLTLGTPDSFPASRKKLSAGSGTNGLCCLLC